MSHAAFVPLVAALSLAGFAAASRASEPDGPRPPAATALPMTLVKVGEDSITVKTMPTDREGSRELTFATDPEETKVTVGVLTDVDSTADGTVRWRYKTQPGTLADLEAGQRVRLTVDGDAATEILVLPPAPPPPARKGDQRNGDHRNGDQPKRQPPEKK